MNRSWLPVSPQTAAAAAIGAVVALALAPAVGQQTPALIRGGGHAGVETEPTFRFTTVGGNRGRADFDRALLKVPASYGEPFAVTVEGKRATLWYYGRDGSVRNVILSDDQTLVRVVSEG